MEKFVEAEEVFANVEAQMREDVMGSNTMGHCIIILYDSLSNYYKQFYTSHISFNKR